MGYYQIMHSIQLIAKKKYGEETIASLRIGAVKQYKEEKEIPASFEIIDNKEDEYLNTTNLKKVEPPVFDYFVDLPDPRKLNGPLPPNYKIPKDNKSFKYYCLEEDLDEINEVIAAQENEEADNLQITSFGDDFEYDSKTSNSKFDKTRNDSLAIIIPYRNREKQLLHFLNIMPKILTAQKLNYKIFVVNQIDDFKFNRGALMNVGYLEARKVHNFACYLLQDVDRVLLQAELVPYACNQKPLLNSQSFAVHLTPKGGAVHTASGKIGGVAKISSNIFEASKGFSNFFYGWGGEDDDFYYRISRELRQPVYQYYDEMVHAKGSFENNTQYTQFAFSTAQSSLWQNCHGEFKTREDKKNLCLERRLLLQFKDERFKENDGFMNAKYQAETKKYPLFTMIDTKFFGDRYQRPEFLAKLLNTTSYLSVKELEEYPNITSIEDVYGN